MGDGCIEDDVVAAYLDGGLTPAEIARVEGHLGACEVCRKDVSALAVVQTMSAQPDAADAIELIPGDRIGRYVLASERARGAMSIVAVAADPELGRDVAIKVLRPELSAQLLRAEARVMARLSHPNVVAVHDVGEHAGRLYVAMELVEGVDLRRWLALEPRGWRAIVTVLIAAGRGLAAAHDAGIVHRDVKPENVLCGPGDRVRVTDFGLASLVADAATGVTGTPRYLAPEVWAGGGATAFSDQWSFCVMLAEALAGAPPFAGDTIEDLRGSIARAPRELPAALPRRLRQIVRRGLARDPAARWPSMDTLLAALAMQLHPRRRWVIAALAAMAIVIVGVRITRPEANPCDVPASLVDDVWSAPAIEAAFARSGRAHGVDSAHRVAQIFARYAGRWRTTRIEACRDARAVGKEGVFAAQARCLDRRRDDLAELARAFAQQPSPAMVDAAVTSAFALPSFEACAAAAVQAEVLRPPSAAIVPLVAAIDRDLSITRAQALRDAGGPTAIAHARAVLATARATAYAPVVARASRALAALSTYASDDAATERELDAALVATAAAHDDRGTAEVWTQRITFLAMTRGTPERAIELGGAAEAAVVRVGSPNDLLASLLHARGIAFAKRGAWEEARTALLGAREHEADPVQRASIDVALGTVEAQRGQRADALARLTAGTAALEKELGSANPQVGVALMNLGSFQFDQHDEAAARVSLERSIELVRAGFGEAHVSYGMALSNLGMLEMRAGNAAKARDVLTRAIANLAQHEHQDLFNALANLGNLETRTGHPAAARTVWERALAVAKATHGADSERAGRALYALGSNAFDAGELAAARGLYRQALAIAIAHHGEAHDRSIEALEAIGLVLQQEDDCAHGVAYLGRAAAAAEAVYGKDDASVARSLTGLGECLVTLGDATALARLERALAIYETHPPGVAPADEAYLRWALAQATWKLAGRTGRARAVGLARAARALYATSGDRDAAALLRDIDRWLASRAR